MPAKKKIFLALSFSISLAFAQTGTAREFADIYTDCGLGAIIAPRTPVVAAITNVTFDLGTTAVSSNISSPETCAGGRARMAAFVHDAYDSLEVELAAGEGKYLDSLTALAGIEQKEKTAFIQDVRKQFAHSVAAPDYTQQTLFTKAENLYNILTQEKEAKENQS
ncbi:MAG: DUF3015 domain-containing protein [Candidatus Electrothrix sp. AX2]|nr:DUF3015 domain-containing protein [Candidatus Electrothrix gigas]